jgi:hypothetical protein
MARGRDNESGTCLLVGIGHTFPELRASAQATNACPKFYQGQKPLQPARSGIVDGAQLV